MTLISITFSDSDIESIADDTGTPIELARARAEGWAKHIQETATQLISEQLASVIEFDTP